MKLAPEYQQSAQYKYLHYTHTVHTVGCNLEKAWLNTCDLEKTAKVLEKKGDVMSQLVDSVQEQ